MSANPARTSNDEPGARPGNKPAGEVRVGNVKIAIWRNSGNSGDFYTASSPQISYKDEQGNWKEGSSYGMTDLLCLSKAADQAAERIIELTKTKSQAR